jgi:hypothetical protein
MEKGETKNAPDKQLWPLPPYGEYAEVQTDCEVTFGWPLRTAKYMILLSEADANLRVFSICKE